MNKKIILIILIFIDLVVFLSGCKEPKTSSIKPISEENHQDSIYKKLEAKIFLANLIPEFDTKIPYYQCDEFTDDALKFYENIDNIKSKYGFLKFSKKNVMNIHDSLKIDTIYSFQDAEKKNVIEIYCADNQCIVFKFVVIDSLFELYGGVKVGMSTTDFMKKFQLKYEPQDYIQIGNLEKNVILKFHFNNGKIVKIDSDLYLD